MNVSKSVESATVARGSSIVYTINYSNSGTAPAEEVQIIESVPEGTTVDTVASSQGWTCDGLGAGSRCTYDAGTLAPGAAGDVQFALVVGEDLPADVTQIDCAVSATTSTISVDGTATSSVPVNILPAPTDIGPEEEPQYSSFIYIPFTSTQ